MSFIGWGTNPIELVSFLIRTHQGTCCVALQVHAAERRPHEDRVKKLALCTVGETLTDATMLEIIKAPSCRTRENKRIA